MQAIEFDTSHTGLASRVSKACLDQDMVLLTTSAFEVVRFIPALIITEDEVRDVLNRFEAALDAVAALGK